MSDAALEELTALLERQDSQKILQEYCCAEPGCNDDKASKSRHIFFGYYTVGPLNMLMPFDPHNLPSEDKHPGRVHSVHTVFSQGG